MALDVVLLLASVALIGYAVFRWRALPPGARRSADARPWFLYVVAALFLGVGALLNLLGD